MLVCFNAQRNAEAYKSLSVKFDVRCCCGINFFSLQFWVKTTKQACAHASTLHKLNTAQKQQQSNIMEGVSSRARV